MVRAANAQLKHYFILTKAVHLTLFRAAGHSSGKMKKGEVPLPVLPKHPDLATSTRFSTVLHIMKPASSRTSAQRCQEENDQL